jgi:acetylornithine deacetylase
VSRQLSDELAELTTQLVAIDSVNPALVPGGAGEAEIARFVADWLGAAGLEVELLGPSERPSVVGVARGSGGGRSLMLNAHTDTVGVAGMEDPLASHCEDGRLYGRGAYDMKGSLAAIMLAGREAARRRLRGDVIVAAVADEEAASIGTETVLEHVRTDAAIVAEPTGLTVGVAHKGFVGLEIETQGRAAHGSRPDLGLDAIAKMGRVLLGIETLDRGLRAEPAHPLLGGGSLHASVIEGGQELSSYPARCRLEVERRTVPGESAARAEEEMGLLLAGLAADDADFHASIRVLFAREPFEIPVDDSLVELVRRQAGGAELSGQAYWADSGLLGAAGVPTVLFGPAGEGAHALVEWVDLASLERCVEVYLAVAAELCA